MRARRAGTCVFSRCSSLSNHSCLSPPCVCMWPKPCVLLPARAEAETEYKPNQSAAFTCASLKFVCCLLHSPQGAYPAITQHCRAAKCTPYAKAAVGKLVEIATLVAFDVYLQFCALPPLPTTPALQHLSCYILTLRTRTCLHASASALPCSS